MAAKGHALIATSGLLALWVTSRTVFALWPLNGAAMSRAELATRAENAPPPLMVAARQTSDPHTALAQPQRFEITPKRAAWPFSQTVLTVKKPSATSVASEGSMPQIAAQPLASAAQSERQILSHAKEAQQSSYDILTKFAVTPKTQTVRFGGPTVSTWALFRPGMSKAALIDNGQLGGSQIGARLVLPVARLSNSTDIGLSARAYMPVGAPRGKEAAIGVRLRQAGNPSFEIIGERRIGMDREGRNAFSLLAVTGLSDVALDKGFTLNAYAQAGVVGTRAHDGFIDGNALVDHALKASSVRVGLGAWGGLQPGAARLDIGPQASVPLPVAGRSLRLSAQWRFRIAGRADPASGPALVIGTDF